MTSLSLGVRRAVRVGQHVVQAVPSSAAATPVVSLARKQYIFLSFHHPVSKLGE